MELRTKKVMVFVGLAYALSYGLLLLYRTLGGAWRMPGSLIVTIAYMLMPMVAAILVQRFVYRESLRQPLRISFRLNRWFLVAWVLPPLLALAAFAASLLMPGVTYSPGMEGLIARFEGLLSHEEAEAMRQQMDSLPVHPLWIGLVQGLVAGATVNAVAAFGEELGWRGLLLRELEPLGFWKLSAVTGVVWGLWHAPIILLGHNYPQHPQFGVLMMTVFTLLLSPLFTLVTLRAGSVIAASVLHGSINATAGLALLVLAGGTDLTVGLTGAAGFLVLVAVNMGIYLYRRRSRDRPETA